MHTRPPILPPVDTWREEDYCLEDKAVGLIMDLRSALDTEPEIKHQFTSYIIDESFRVAFGNGRRVVSVDDVLRAYSRIYDSWFICPK